MIVSGEGTRSRAKTWDKDLQNNLQVLGQDRDTAGDWVAWRAATV